MHLKDSCVGLPQWLSSKESACSAGDEVSTPGSGRPGGGHGNPPQYSCLENPMDRGDYQAMVYGVAKSQTGLKRLSTFTHREGTKVTCRNLSTSSVGI